MAFVDERKTIAAETARDFRYTSCLEGAVPKW